jgi:hypothetical protein
MDQSRDDDQHPEANKGRDEKRAAECNIRSGL